MYVKTNWVNGSTPINATNLNKIEQGLEDAVFESDSSGNWKWKKYADGTYEAVFKMSSSYTIQTSGFANWYRNANDYTLTLPDEIGNVSVDWFDVKLMCGFAGIFGCPFSVSGNTLSYYLYAPTQRTGTGTIFARVIGTWE